MNLKYVDELNSTLNIKKIDIHIGKDKGQQGILIQLPG